MLACTSAKVREDLLSSESKAIIETIIQPFACCRLTLFPLVSSSGFESHERAQQNCMLSPYTHGSFLRAASASCHKLKAADYDESGTDNNCSPVDMGGDSGETERSMC